MLNEIKIFLRYKFIFLFLKRKSEKIVKIRKKKSKLNFLLKPNEKWTNLNA